MNGALWRKVVPELAPDFRCIAPDWPLGSHEVPLGDQADRTAGGMARLIADFMTELGLEDVTLVGNDSGGALCQLVVTRHPERVGRLVQLRQSPSYSLGRGLSGTAGAGAEAAAGDAGRADHDPLAGRRGKAARACPRCAGRRRSSRH